MHPTYAAVGRFYKSNGAMRQLDIRADAALRDQREHEAVVAVSGIPGGRLYTVTGADLAPPCPGAATPLSRAHQSPRLHAIGG